MNMPKPDAELPLPAPKQYTGVRVKEVPVQPGTPRWAWWVIGMLSLVLVGGAVLIGQRYSDAASADRQTDQIAASARTAARSDCALDVAAEYEERRDAILTALGESPVAGRAAAMAFTEFRLGPNGQPESRAERTVRLCGSAAAAVKGGNAAPRGG